MFQSTVNSNTHWVVTAFFSLFVLPFVHVDIVIENEVYNTMLSMKSLFVLEIGVQI